MARLDGPVVALAIVATLAWPARAGQVVTMTPANVNSALAALRPGDTLRAIGTFTSPLVLRHRDFGNVRVDASAAVFREGVALTNVHNISFHGGTYGREDTDIAAWYRIDLNRSTHVSFANISVLSASNSRGSGLVARNSQFITVRDSLFTGPSASMALTGTTNSLVVRNDFIGSFGDGINLINGNRLIVADNSCTRFSPGVGAHPDCIQMWSQPGMPLVSDIYLLNNVTIGRMQGFFATDPKSGAGVRLTFAGNYAAVTYPHTISCIRCADSRFIDNVLSNLPETIYGTAPVQTMGGTGNQIGNNLSYDLRGRTDGWLPPRVYSNLAGLVGSQWDDRSHAYRQQMLAAASPSVPEPANWLIMAIGFAMVGRQLRRRRGPRRVPA